MTTLEKVQAQIMKLQARADALIARQSTKVIETIRDLMAKYGLTVADIDAHVGGKKRGPKPGAQAAVRAGAPVAKYRDPKSGATWTGHGRAPAWIAKAKDRSRFLVEGSAEGAAPAPAREVKTAGKYVRGPQPAKYRDPKSGATWSGRGPAPAWLARAKDRSRFLIAGADKGAASPKAVVAKKAATRKTASENRAAKKSLGVAKTTAEAKVLAKKAAAVNKVMSQRVPAAGKKAAPKKPAAKKAPAKKVAVKPQSSVAGARAAAENAAVATLAA
jgi:DNA-binding protein H-NS